MRGGNKEAAKKKKAIKKASKKPKDKANPENLESNAANSLFGKKRVRAVCPPDQYSALAVGGGCVLCPPSTRCGIPGAPHASQGTTLATLDLLPNHWRLTNRSTDIRECVRVRQPYSPCLHLTCAYSSHR